MKVYIHNSGQSVNLTQRDYVGAGGEGTVYARSGTAYKIYHDPQRMIPLGKFQELAQIQDPAVVKPQAILTGKAGKAIGYTFKFVPKAWTLCQLFPPAFRQREGVTPEMTQALVRKLQEHIGNIHSADVLVVDLNEMNFLVDHGFSDVYCIDVDSYQTPHYPAPAIMESIRDWSVANHQWGEISDWFSFGVVSFQMFIGLHPFKGRYKGREKQFKSRLPTDADDDAFSVTRRRMQHNISVFHGDVGVPRSALPFDAIPPAYRAWYEALFSQGKRAAPPTDFGAPVVFIPIVKTIKGTAALDIAEILDCLRGTIIGVWGSGTHIIVATDKGVWTDKSLVGGVLGQDYPRCTAMGFTPRVGRAVGAGLNGRQVVLYNLTDRATIPFTLQGDEITSYDGRIYVRTADRVHEVVLTDAGAKVIASTREVAQTLPYASRLYPGVVVQEMLGASYVSLLVRSGAAQQVRIKELDDYRVMDAKFDSGVLMVVGEQKGQYDRLVFRFDNAGTYDVRVVDNVAITGLNFVTLDSGVCVCLNEEEKLEMFSAKQGSKSIKYVEDKGLSGDMLLSQNVGKVLFSQGHKVYTMRMR